MSKRITNARIAQINGIVLLEAGTPYTTKTGKTQFKPSLKSLQKIIEGNNSEGFCLACGKKATGVEPDARKYECQFCHEPKVYGAEELVMMGIHS